MSTDARQPAVFVARLSANPVAAVPSIVPADGVGRWLAAGIAAAAHGAVLAMFAAAPAPDISGAAGQRLAAIDIVLVDGKALAARPHVRAEPQAAAPAQGEIAAVDGSPIEVNASNASPAPEVPAERAVVAETAKALPPSAAADGIPVAELKESRPPPAPEAIPLGGVAARADDRAPPARAVAAASPGAINRYANQVRAALARNKPKGRGNRGTVTIRFVISSAGKIASAQVTRSSGNARLDQAALNAVERTTFPRPPVGMTEPQRSYVVPFRFE